MLATPKKISLHMEACGSHDFNKSFEKKTSTRVNLAIFYGLNISTHWTFSFWLETSLENLADIILILFWRLWGISNMSKKYFPYQVALDFKRFIFWYLCLGSTIKSWSQMCFYFILAITNGSGVLNTEKGQRV